ncbi:MAG TPA: lamin tail domain-containing protein [Blastocatellia bacterium]|nr:lamin tail domain-containing protein [Blastocatellia bacterium]
MRRTLTLSLLLISLCLSTFSAAQVVPSKGADTTLDIASWNIEWFGDTSNGPTNESLQLQNARAVIAGANMDIWGVAEIVSLTQWNSLKSQLPGYAGFLAKEPNVINGAAFYSGFGNTEQNVGILYKTSIATVTDARVVLTANDFDFGGRPPLQVTLRVTLNGAIENIVVIIIHAKCCSDSESWTRRRNAANALKSYLDTNFPTQKVWVIGDFNDDVDTSITSGNASPYANFVNDGARYRFPTKALSDSGIPSTTSFPDTIDHHLNSNEANATYVNGSVEVFRVDQFIPNYGATTSDHYPVLSRYAFGGGASAQVIINEIRANEPGSNTAGEFVELVNIGGTTANIGGWTISDGSASRHTFAAGTMLNPGKAIVVFGAASAIPAGLSNAVAASSGGLSLNNSSDTVTVRDSGGAVKNSFAYTSALASTDGVSMNRNPDGTAAGTFVLHTSISSALSSPGVRASGAPW